MTDNEALYQFRPYRSDDRRGVMRLFREVWGEPAALMAEQRWTWKFENNPRAKNKPMVIYIMEKQGQVKGIIAGLWDKLKINNKVIDILWVADYMMASDSRGKAAIKLGKKFNQEQHYLRMSFPVASIHRLVKVYFGEQDMCQLFCYLRMNNVVAALVKRHLPVDLARIVQWIWATALKGYTWFLPKIKWPYVLKTIERFDESSDDLFKNCCNTYPVLVVRDHDYLNWRFTDCPGRAYCKVGLYKNHVLVGYMVYRIDHIEGKKIGHIIDFLYPQDKVIYWQYLLNGVLSAMTQAHVTGINLTMSSSNSGLKKMLFKSGFWFKRADAKGVYCNRSSQIINRDLHAIKDGFFTMGDSDLDFY